MNSNLLDPSRWGLIFILLSMDLAGPFIEHMGLRSVPQDRFRTLLRGWIQENRRHYLSDRSKIPDFTTFVLSQIDKEFGQAVRLRLEQWGAHVFCFIGRDQPDWTAWHVALQRWLYNQQARAELLLPELRRDELLAYFRNTVETADVAALIEQQKKLPMSEWDLEMYAIHLFNDEVGPDPYDAILATVEVYRLQAFWPQLLLLLNSEAQDVLWQTAKVALARIGIGRGEELPHPTAMRPTEV